jgi:hypothetical protein
VNVDAAVVKIVNHGVVSAVCRSSDGAYLGAPIVIFEGITHPGYLEAMARKEALAPAADLHVGKVTVASDCMEVMQSLHGKAIGLFSQILCEVDNTVCNFAASRQHGWSGRGAVPLFSLFLHIMVASITNVHRHIVAK